MTTVRKNHGNLGQKITNFEITNRFLNHRHFWCNRGAC